RGHVDGATAIGAAFGAIETFNENLALELGPAGVRSVCVRTVANIDSRAIQGTIDFIVGANKDVTKQQIIAKVAMQNFLSVPAGVQATANAVAFAASDRARMLTGTVLNASAGASPD